MFVQVINIGITMELNHSVVVRTDDPDSFVAWVQEMCPSYMNLKRLDTIDQRFPDLKYCVRVDLNDRDLMMFKLRWR